MCTARRCRGREKSKNCIRENAVRPTSELDDGLGLAHAVDGRAGVVGQVLDPHPLDVEAVAAAVVAPAAAGAAPAAVVGGDEAVPGHVRGQLLAVLLPGDLGRRVGMHSARQGGRQPRAPLHRRGVHPDVGLVWEDWGNCDFFLEKKGDFLLVMTSSFYIPDDPLSYHTIIHVLMRDGHS